MSEHRGALTSEGERYPSPRHTLEYLEVELPAPGSAVPLAPGFLWARIPLPMELNHINVWLLDGGDRWTVVDTGLSDDVCRNAWQDLEQVALGGRSLGRVFVTHDHPDHMGLAAWLHERHGAEVWMSPQGHRSTGEFLAADPHLIDVRRHTHLTAHGLEMGDAPKRVEGAVHGGWYGKLPPLHRGIVDGERVTAGGREWTVIETSGHCRGHLCLFDAVNRVLISGDQVLPTISPNVSVLTTRPDSDPLGEFLDSLDKLALCPPDTLVLPSHGRPFHGLHRRIDTLRRHHLESLDKLEAACREAPRSAADLLPVMFGRALRGFHRFLALGEAVAHLNRLWHAGRVERRIDADGRVTFAAS